MRRFRVVEDSMLPALRPGDEFVASSSLPATPGDIVAAPMPGEDDFWLVKRVGSRTGIPEGQLWLTSDNPGADAIDSNAFGPVAAATALTRVDRLDATTFAEAAKMLAGEDEDFFRVLAEHGRPDFWSRTPGFATITLLVLEQQVSLESGAAMFRRLREALGAITPESVSQAGAERLRSLGVTRQKSRYLENLALEVTHGELDLDSLESADARSARERLLQLAGIGPWTADAYLLSALRHPDVFPVGDRALQVGAGELLGMSAVPTPDELEIVGEPWRPVRAVAARLIWHSYLSSRGRVEPEVAL